MFCTTCGPYTSRRCLKLGQDCIGKKLPGAKTPLPRIMSGLHPHYRNEEGRVSSTSRRGVNYICYAATTPPPPEVSRPAFGMEGSHPGT
eukprot:217946-Pyramimonas_sp.AAC.1